MATDVERSGEQGDELEGGAGADGGAPGADGQEAPAPGGGAPPALIESDQFQTPRWFFDALHRKYNFQHDLCARAENALLPRFYSLEDSALEHEWWPSWMNDASMGAEGWDWCNPPYSKPNLDLFTTKARLEMKYGWAGVFLVPATPGAGWFQRNVFGGASVVSSGGTNPAEPELRGYWFKLEPIGGGTITVTFLARRLAFFNPFRPEVKDSAKADSCLIEWRPRRLC